MPDVPAPTRNAKPPCEPCRSGHCGQTRGVQSASDDLLHELTRRRRFFHRLFPAGDTRLLRVAPRAPYPLVAQPTWERHSGTSVGPRSRGRFPWRAESLSVGPWGHRLAVGPGQDPWKRRLGAGHGTRVLGPPRQSPQTRRLKRQTVGLSQSGGRSPRSQGGRAGPSEAVMENVPQARSSVRCPLAVLGSLVWGNPSSTLRRWGLGGSTRCQLFRAGSPPPTYPETPPW